MITINKLVSNSIVITTGPVDDGKTRVKYTASSGIPDWEGDIVGELTSSSIPNISDAEVVEIGSHVTSIGQAFSGCWLLTSVTIPDSVTSIGNFAFIMCNSLTIVTIGDGVTSIGERAFSGCSGLTSVTIPDSVTTIEEHAFEECSGLTNVMIGNGVTSIGESVFYNCSSLMSVTFSGKNMATVQGMSDYSWQLPSGCKIHCTDGDITL